MRSSIQRVLTSAIATGVLLTTSACSSADVPSSVSTPSIAVPNLVGVPAARAHRQLDRLDLVTDFDAGDETVHDESAWVVTKTDPAAGTRVFWGSAIVVYVTRRS